MHAQQNKLLSRQLPNLILYAVNVKHKLQLINCMQVMLYNDFDKQPHDIFYEPENRRLN